ncbi:MAG: hypothetical protein KGD64_12470, partial [Candidatus Heimdallarchaeota archaeon]|nr:hypothetical protein [Candidatus Heimdallarchaeota archaeon]
GYYSNAGVPQETGIQIENEPIISDVTIKLAERLRFDPYRLLSSGVLILLAKDNTANKIIEHCSENNIPCSIIGKVTDNKGSIISGNKIVKNLEADEIIKALKALEKIKND